MAQKIDILGVSVDRVGVQELRQRCDEWLSGRAGALHQIVTVNPEFVMEARGNQEFRRVLNNAAVALADGIGLVLASRLLHGRARSLSRITGVDFALMLAELCAKNGARLHLVGAGPGVAERAAEVLRKKYPSLQISGAEEGIKKISNFKFQISKLNMPNIQEYPDVTINNDERLCARITAAKTDVLLVALGAPKQDLWIAENAARLGGVRIAAGVGGTFDYLAGVVPYAPAPMRTLGLEWLYRLVTQPRRWRRIVTAVIFFPLTVLLSSRRRQGSSL